MRFIPQLLRINNTEERPFAEYWMGAHPVYPSLIETGDKEIALTDFISLNPERILGTKVWSAFKGLPFLLKVQDVRRVLSIQVHPNKEEAGKGFERENQAGIPLTAPHRNYRDDNHKPEMMVAIGEFWLLHGFKKEEVLRQTLLEEEAFRPLLEIFDTKGLKGLYEWVMLMSQEEVNNILNPLVQQAIKKKDSTKREPAYWVALATKDSESPLDRGIFSMYFFNTVQLKAGDGIFQPAGLPHAYLEGQGMELMSNSDNVLRGGLTPKHIDVPELLRHIQFEGIEPKIMPARPEAASQKYDSPVPDFYITRIRLTAESPFHNRADSVEICFVLEGSARFDTKDLSMDLISGEAVFIPYDEAYTISGEGLVFRAAVNNVEG